jgi:hypothetical protein
VIAAGRTRAAINGAFEVEGSRVAAGPPSGIARFRLAAALSPLQELHGAPAGDRDDAQPLGQKTTQRLAAAAGISYTQDRQQRQDPLFSPR